MALAKTGPTVFGKIDRPPGCVVGSRSYATC